VRALVLACALLAGAASTAAAQTRAWIAGVLYESPGFVVPILVLDSAADDGRDWRLSVVGWTLTAERAQRVSDRRRHVLTLDVTPVNADNSRYVYRAGEVDDVASYGAASIRAAGGVDLAHGDRWTGGYRLVGSYRRVSDLEDEAVRDAWRHPFAGVEITQAYRRTRSSERFGARADGLLLKATWRGFAGDRAWSQLEAEVAGGRHVGRLFVAGRAAGFAGQGLDVVNAFLIGGSWSVSDARMVTGFRFGELRLDRAIVASGAASVRLGGAWELGARGAVLGTRHGAHAGLGVEARTVIRGIAIDGGVAWPVGGNLTDRARRAVAFMGLTFAIVQ
jgi:hypothetical protein